MNTMFSKFVKRRGLAAMAWLCALALCLSVIPAIPVSADEPAPAAEPDSGLVNLLDTVDATVTCTRADGTSSTDYLDDEDYSLAKLTDGVKGNGTGGLMFKTGDDIYAEFYANGNDTPYLITVDLGDVYEVSEVVLTSAFGGEGLDGVTVGALPIEYSVGYSEDGVYREEQVVSNVAGVYPADSEIMADTVLEHKHTFAPVETRYIHLYISWGCVTPFDESGAYCAIGELEIMGQAAAELPPDVDIINVAENAMVSVDMSTVLNMPGWHPSQMVDGIVSAGGQGLYFWGNGGSFEVPPADSREIVVELEYISQIYGLDLYAFQYNPNTGIGYGLPTNISVYASLDGEDYGDEPVYTYRGDGLIDSIDAPDRAIFRNPVKAKYVKLVTNSYWAAGQNGIGELELLGVYDDPKAEITMTNVALGKPTLSSVAGAGAFVDGWGDNYLVDGQTPLSSGVTSGQIYFTAMDSSNPGYITIGLTRECTIYSFRLTKGYTNGTMALPRGYTFQYSMDGNTYYDALVVEDAYIGAQSLYYHLEEAVTARYVRLKITSDSGWVDHGLGFPITTIGEIEVFGVAETLSGDFDNVAEGAKVIVEEGVTLNTNSWADAMMTDGNIGSVGNQGGLYFAGSGEVRELSNPDGTREVVVQLNGEKKLYGFEMYPMQFTTNVPDGYAMPSAYNLYTSMTGEAGSYTLVYSTAGQFDVGKQDGIFAEAVNAKYVKIEVTGFSTTALYSTWTGIGEFVLLGEDVGEPDWEVPTPPEPEEFEPFEEVYPALTWVETAPTLTDKSLADWATLGIDPIFIDSTNMTAWNGTVPVEFTANTYFAINNKNLYVAVDITDSNVTAVAGNHSDIANYTTGDAIQLGIDFGKDLPDGESIMFYSFGYNGDGGQVFVAVQNNNDRVIQASGMTFRTDDGWAVEFSISLEQLYNDYSQRTWNQGGDNAITVDSENPLEIGVAVYYLDSIAAGTNVMMPQGGMVAAFAANNGEQDVTWQVEDVVINLACEYVNGMAFDCEYLKIGHVHNEVADAAVAPTCTETGLTEGSHCTECGATVIAQETVEALGHSEIVDEAVDPDCTETGLTEGKHCDRCNETLTAQEPIDALGHETVIDAAVEAGCEETGLAEGSHCDRCGEVILPQATVAAKGHNAVADAAVSATCTETGLAAGFHCDRCGKITFAQTEIPALEHNPVSDNNGVDATCTETGLTASSTCDRCGETVDAQAEIPAKGHGEGVGNDDAVAPTCTETGWNASISCPDCGEVLTERTPIDALGHTEAVDESVAPTCTETGLTEGKHCEVCGEILVAQETVDALGHQAISDGNAVDPTCTETGLTASTSCPACDELLSGQRTVEALEHIEVSDENGVDANCTESGLTASTHCDRCGETLTEQTVINALGHDPVIDNGVPPTCTETGVTSDTHCQRCDATLEGEQIIPALGHNEVSDENGVAPTCTETGLTASTHCDRCGETVAAQAEIPAKGHGEGVGNDDAVAPTCTETGWNASISCPDCGEILTERTPIDALGHTEVVDAAVAPTCTETGLAEGKHCDVCGETLVAQEPVDALGHNEVVDAAIAPTCTETGLTEGKHCDRCNETLTAQENVEALGHTEVIDAAVEAPSCLETGLTEGSHCEVCGETIQAQTVIPAIGYHTAKADANVEPTCTETGVSGGYSCSVCGEILTAPTEVPALGHNPVNDNNATAPTCTETGLTASSTCSRCGETVIAQTIVDALGHETVVDAAVDPDCTETGLTEGAHCGRCGEILVAQETVEALGHNPVSDENGVDATCTEAGLTASSTCDRCGETVTAQTVVDALGHETVVDAAVDPDCTETGLTEGAHCDVCGETLVAQETVEALGHNPVSDENGVDATCTETGLTASSTCDRCGETVTAQETTETIDHVYEDGVCVNCGDSEPDESTPDESTPDESTPDESTPDESTPDESTPDESTPDESTPDESTPDESTPDETDPTVPVETQPTETKAPADDGCASVVGFGAVALLSAVAAAVALKKKED